MEGGNASLSEQILDQLWVSEVLSIEQNVATLALLSTEEAIIWKGPSKFLIL